jgi:DNA-binding transcriptional LysR family regulator
MTIRNLEIFEEVCRCMNMSKAAQNLCVSQSSVSQAVASLEKEYNTILFERLNHTLYLTDSGKELLFLSHQVLKTIDQLENRMKDSAYKKKLKLGVSTTICDCLIYSLLEDYEKQYGDINISVEMGNTKSMEKKLLTAKMDMAIIQRTSLSHFLKYIPFLEDRMAVVCRTDHPLCGKTVPLAQLKGENMVVREKGSGTQMLIDHIFTEHRIPMKKSWTCMGSDSVKKAVFHKVGIAVISRFLVAEELKQGMLGEIYISDQEFTRWFDLVYHKDKIQNGEFKSFLEFCRSLNRGKLEKLIEEGIQK